MECEVCKLWESSRSLFVELRPMREGLSKFMREFGPYSPHRNAFGKLKDGRLVFTVLS